ncbi:WAT1-related protein At4g08300-like isoform X2 [Juglans microcarpa x Juglans regia]|uniref:WAT1-related protein At4g08300-like isoform X2 n=1 Tax=Juglans microcarpa x Juglans regia TaxID=2249226 RepID=UPI001B7DC20F|nr:WAT1-related protein At4g08300-like isoform X2 [Juglans microcarpa x Juglans regia]
MAPAADKLRVNFRRFKPHLLMVLVQIGYTFLYLFTDACFNHGMDPHIFVTYRHILGGLVMLPFAYFLERKVRPKLTLALFLEMFLLSLLGLETVDIRNPRGMAKVLGTSISLAGVLVATLYKGPEVRSWKSAPIHITRTKYVHENWIKGPILTVVSCLTWSSWFIMQGITLKKYPAQLSLTAWINFIGAAQSAVFTVIILHKPAAWSIAFDIDLWSIVYAGVVCAGLATVTQLWCIKQKGPVFVTMFNPLGTLFVGLQEYFLLGKRLHAGRILGGSIVILGLYVVLWGKEGDQYHFKSQERAFSTDEEPKEPPKIQSETSEREVP